MAGFWDNVPGSGILNTVGSNVAAGQQYQNQALDEGRKDLGHGIGHTIVGVRNLIQGEEQTNKDKAAAGIIPAPDDSSQQPAPDQQASGQSQTPPSAPQIPGGQPTGDKFDSKSLLTKPDPNSQEGGADAKNTQQEELDKSKQQVADDTVKGGGIPTPTTVDPAKAFADRNQNIQAGVGNSITGINTVDTPQTLTDQQQKNADLHQAGQDTFKSMNTIGDWFQSPSFLMGMMQTGLSLLDGKGFAESFKTGADYFDQHYGMEQRKSWADDLLNKGYDRQQIEQYIRTGDSAILKSPQQQAFEQQSQQLKLDQAQQQVLSQKYANDEAAYKQSPEYREYQIQQDQINNQYKQNQIQYQNWNMQQKQAMAPLQQQMAQARLQQVQNKIAADQAKSANVSTIQDAQGNPLQVTHLKVGDYYIVADAKGGPKINAKGVAAVVDPVSGQTTVLSLNKQAAEAAQNSSNRSLRLINNFDGKGNAVFGPTGEATRAFLDMFGQRASPDAKSQLGEIQRSLHSAALAKVEMEANGNAVREGQLKAEVDSLPTLVNEHTGEIADVSPQEAARILNEWRNYVGFVGQASTAQITNQPESLNPQSIQNYVPAGRATPDGRYISLGGDQYNQSTWVTAEQYQKMRGQ